MNNLHLIHGFSEIKSLLITKARLEKPVQELELWFSQNNDMIFVHDMGQHEKNTTLALYAPRLKEWRIYLPEGRR